MDVVCYAPLVPSLWLVPQVRVCVCVTVCIPIGYLGDQWTTTVGPAHWLVERVIGG